MEEIENNTFREIWNWNRYEEMSLIEECLRRNHRFIAIDTEFPGCLRETSQDATDEERYEDMRFSVDKTKLIQLGLTLFDDEGTIGGTWEINFSDFGDIDDARNEKSIEFLKRNGLNLEKIRKEGISIDDFFTDLICVLYPTSNITWVTFHGCYDIAYLLKYFTGESLPVTSRRFSKEVARNLDSVYDLKVMAGCCKGLGLENLAYELKLKRLGTAHHAGSDSELTARVFTKMVQIYENVEDYEGFVYGLGYRIVSDRIRQKLLMMMIYRMKSRRCYGPTLSAPLLRPRPRFISGFQPFDDFDLDIEPSE